MKYSELPSPPEHSLISMPVRLAAGLSVLLLLSNLAARTVQPLNGPGQASGTFPVAVVMGCGASVIALQRRK